MRVRRRRAIVAGLVVAAAGVAGGVIVTGGDGVDDPVDDLGVGEITTVLGDGGESDGTGEAGVETGIGRVTFVAVGSDGTLWASGFNAGTYTVVDGRTVDVAGAEELASEVVAMAADGDTMLAAVHFGRRAVRVADGELLGVAGAEALLVQQAAGTRYAVGPTNVAPLPDGEVAFTAGPGPVWRTVDGGVEAVEGFPPTDGAPGVTSLIEGFASDADGTLYLANEGAGTITSVTTEGVVRTVARDLDVPGGIAIGPDGTMYVAEVGGHRVVAIDAAGGEPVVVAGRGAPGFSGDGGPATAAALATPEGLATDGELLWIADRGNERVRVVRLR